MGSGGGPPPDPFTVAMTGEGGFFRLVDPLSFLLLHSRAPGSVSVPPGGPARPPVETRPYYVPGGGRGGNKQRRRSSRPRPAASLRLAARQDGWVVPGLPACTRRSVHRVEPLTWCLPPRPPGYRDPPPGPGPGPPGTLSGLSACHARHQLSYRPGLGPAGRVAIAILFSLPGSARSPRGHRMQGLRFF
ncbi:hypothetical protein NDU88_003507 [Pleurodeles waltl]|uniref:Uncharacterized protein n=1 Tax=Pleurodeles waltl TaxID=8319 RepID=A0AAV7QBX5_PLEWA|nr:hypothetical protein NDU88_003507 [Pleurodeles waltl]